MAGRLRPSHNSVAGDIPPRRLLCVRENLSPEAAFGARSSGRDKRLVSQQRDPFRSPNPEDKDVWRPLVLVRLGTGRPVQSPFVAFTFVSSHFMPSCPVSFCFIYFHLFSSHLGSASPIPSLSSDPFRSACSVPSRPVQSYPIPSSSYPFNSQIPFYPVPSRTIPSHPFPSHPAPSRPVPPRPAPSAGPVRGLLARCGPDLAAGYRTRCVG